MSLFAELHQLSAGFSGSIGLWARSLATGETVEFGEARAVFPSASVIKLPILYELLEQVSRGRLRLSDQVTLTGEQKVPGAGVLQEMSDGISLPVIDLATLMIIISDNTASNICIDLVGAEAVTRRMAELGLPGLQLHNKFFRAVPGRPGNQAVPVDLGMLMDRIVRREVLTPEACDTIVGIMKRTHDPLIARFLPDYNDYVLDGKPALEIASKAGAIQGCRHEVAAVWQGERGYVISIMTKECKDLRYHTDNEGQLLVGRVAAAVHQHFLGK